MNKFYLLLLLIAGCICGVDLSAQSNQYLHLDRVDDYVRLDDGSQFIANKDAFSMAGWFYHDELVYGQGMMGFRSPNQGFYIIQLNDGVLECRMETTTLYEFVAPAFTVLPETWQHFAWVYDGSSISLFVNGVLAGSSFASGQITETDIPFTVGRSILSNLDFYMGGRCDEVSLWDKALTAADLTDMMANELSGTEANLQLYYKCNQGDPGGDNSGISTLVSEVEPGIRDADLIGFAMTGEESNFNGMLEVGFQTIAFGDIPNKLISDQPFEVVVDASSALPVDLVVVSGPASLNGNTVSLNGTPGEVVISANQSGNGEFAAASEVLKTFQVVDPQITTPNIEMRHPLAGTVEMSALGPLKLAAYANTDFPELLSVDKLQFVAEGQIIPAVHHGNGYYTASWTPSEVGSFVIQVQAFNNYDGLTDEATQVLTTVGSIDKEVDAFTDVLINSGIATETVEVDLPSHRAGYSQILGTLELNCPPGGCDPWDRTSSVEVRTQEGDWVELIHYITAYGTACDDVIDLTDFAAALRGKVAFRVTSVTFANGYEWNLKLNYTAGTPEYAHSKILPMWKGTYDFGDFDNLQPVEAISVAFPENTAAAKLKLVSSGHGWSDTQNDNINTSNAAEFFNTEHYIWVDGADSYVHDYWTDCNPNPAGCSPQPGTWSINRAGFCPGAISQFFDYDLTNTVASGAVELDYVFDEQYVDLCHPNHPDCVTGVTCPNCDAGFNPNIVVGSVMVLSSNEPFDAQGTPSAIRVIPDRSSLRLYPNPTDGMVELRIDNLHSEEVNIEIFNAFGVLISKFEKQRLNESAKFDLSKLPAGAYIVTVKAGSDVYTEKLMIN